MFKIKCLCEDVFFTILTIFLIFNIKFFFLPPIFIIAASILTIMSIFYFFKNFKFKKTFIKPTLFFSLIFIFISLHLSFGNIDLFILNIILAIFFLITIAPYAYFSYFKSQEIKIIRYIVYAGLINAIFIIGMFIFSGFRDIYLSLLVNGGLGDTISPDAADSFYAMRMVGLLGSATYGMAFIQVTMSFIYVYLVYLESSEFSFYNYIIISLLLISAVVSGRTAFIGILLLSILIFLLFKKIKFILIFILYCIALGGISLSLASIFLPEDFYSFFVDWVFEIFNKGSEVGSLQENIDMYHYRFSDFSLLGDLKWFADDAKSSYYMNTDVGWYRFLFAFGYLGVTLFVMFIFSFINLSNPFKGSNILAIVLIIFIFIVMFKGAIIFDFYPIFFFLAIIYRFSMIEKNDKNHIR